MNGRTKIGLMATALALVMLSFGVRLYVVRAGVIREVRSLAEEVAEDIAEDLKADLPGTDAAANRVLEKKMLGYINRHSRIVQLGLYPAPSSPSSPIMATRNAEALESTRPPAAVELTKVSAERAPPAIIEVPVETSRIAEGSPGHEVEARAGRSNRSS